MSTNLVIGYPDFLFYGTDFAIDTAATGFDGGHIINGDRIKHYKQSGVDTGVIASINRGSGNDSQPGYLYIARMDLILKTGTHNVRLEGGTGPSTWVEAKTHTGATTSDLVGPNKEDYVWAPSGLPYSSDYQYWRLEIWNTLSNSHAFEFSNVAFGNAQFDFGRDPSTPFQYRRRAARQNFWNAPREFDMVWEGVTNDKLESFIDLIWQYRDINPVFLHDQNDYLFDGDTLIHAKIVDGRFEAHPGKINTVMVKFREMLG